MITVIWSCILNTLLKKCYLLSKQLGLQVQPPDRLGTFGRLCSFFVINLQSVPLKSWASLRKIKSKRQLLLQTGVQKEEHQGKVHLLAWRELQRRKKKGTKKERNVQRNLMELRKQLDRQFTELEMPEQVGAFQFHDLLPGVRTETGCHGYLGFLKLIGRSSKAPVSWGPGRAKDEMEAHGCGGAILGSRRSKSPLPTAFELKFHFKSHSSGSLRHVRPSMPFLICPFPYLPHSCLKAITKH